MPSAASSSRARPVSSWSYSSRQRPSTAYPALTTTSRTCSSPGTRCASAAEENPMRGRSSKMLTRPIRSPSRSTVAAGRVQLGAREAQQGGLARAVGAEHDPALVQFHGPVEAGEEVVAVPRRTPTPAIRTTRSSSSLGWIGSLTRPILSAVARACAPARVRRRTGRSEPVPRGGTPRRSAGNAGCGTIRTMTADAPVTPVTRGSFWRRRAIDLLLVASAGCTRARLR